MSRGRDQKDLLDLVTFGIFLLIVGVIFLITPDLLDRGYGFIRDLELRELSSNIYIPAPISDHSILFTALSKFCFYFAVLQIPVLVARIVLKDPADKKAGAISGLVFWFGAAWIINLLIAKDVGWFTFLGYLITLLGVTIVVKNIISLGTQVYKGSES